MSSSSLPHRRLDACFGPWVGTTWYFAGFCEFDLFPLSLLMCMSVCLSVISLRNVWLLKLVRDSFSAMPLYFARVLLLCSRECCEVLRSVCLSIGLSVSSHISKITCPNFTKFYIHVASGRGSVIL